MLAQAKSLAEAGDYEEAEIKAKLAKKLADKARAAGEAAWEDCQKAKNTPVVVEKPKDEIDNLLKDGRLGTIYFDYDEATLTDRAQKTLQQNAEWMRRNASARVQVEGHCDERGTTEYNIALGERRAQTVERYLINQGFSPSRMSMISFGEERPAVSGSNEAAWAQNRRVELKVVE